MVFRNKEKEILIVVSWIWIVRENIAFVLNLWPESLLSGRNELPEKMVQYPGKSRRKEWKILLRKDNRKNFSSKNDLTEGKYRRRMVRLLLNILPLYQEKYCSCENLNAANEVRRRLYLIQYLCEVCNARNLECPF